MKLNAGLQDPLKHQRQRCEEVEVRGEGSIRARYSDEKGSES
jgi:hypothetical protein